MLLSSRDEKKSFMVIQEIEASNREAAERGSKAHVDCFPRILDSFETVFYPGADLISR